MLTTFKGLVDIGTVPYNSAIRSVLMVIESPDQLRALEENCPQILGHDKEIWIKLIKRDVAKYAEIPPPEPTNPKNWYKLYKKLVRENEREMEAQAEQLRLTLTGIQEARVDRGIQAKDKDELPQLPRPDGYTPHPRKPAAPKFAKTETLRFGAGSRTKIKSAADLITRARRGAREAAFFRPGGSNLATPNHMLNAQASIVMKAPPSLTAPPRSALSTPATDTRTSTVTARPHSNGAATGPRSQMLAMSVEEKERRLNAIKKRKLDTSTESLQAPKVEAASPTLSSPSPESSPSLAPPPMVRLSPDQLPRRKGPDPQPEQPQVKRRPTADPFMPAKRRKVN